MATPETITITAQADPCSPAFRTYYYSPTLLNRVRYNLCVATHTAIQKISDAGHWVWAQLENFWNRFSQIVASLESGLVQFVDGLTQTVQTALQNLAYGIGRLLDWLSSSGVNWLLLIAGGILLFELAPAINDTVHAATKRSRK